MNWSIKNGILLIGSDRIILAHVSRWQVTQQAIVFHIHGHQNSINMGAEAAKLDAELTAWFVAKPDPSQTFSMMNEMLDKLNQRNEPTPCPQTPQQ